MNQYVSIFGILILCVSISCITEFPAFHNHLKYHNEYDKYTAGLNKNFKIPTLENLFEMVTYMDNNNVSSPCTHVGKKRDTLCHKIVTFDKSGYEKSLQDTKNLILSRLNLDHEPQIKINKNTLNFLEQLESKVLNEPESSQSTLKTRYDMKSPENKIFSSMHEASDISSDCQKSEMTFNSDSLCINFDVPIKTFYKESNMRMVQRKLVSAVLWIYIRISDQITNDNIKIQIQNFNLPKKSTSFYLKSLNDGWNTINITNVFRLPSISPIKASLNEKLNFTIIVKCLKNCSIGYVNEEVYEIEDDEGSKDILISNHVSKKPLLTVNIQEDENVSDLLANGVNADRSLRTKRRANNNNHHAGNFKAHGIEANYNPKLCYNNYPDADRECCLITYFVNFNSLKWSSWILSPSGFVANYCSGKCNDLKSFKYASHNAEVKLKYNQKLLTESSESSEMLETCCHPVSMDSLVVKYLASNGSVVSTVIPNMIITGCGCS